MALDEHEEAFVRAFIRKERRARYLYLFGTPKRRQKVGVFLDHTLIDDLIPEYRRIVPHDYSTADIAAYLRRRGAGDTCHVISADIDESGVAFPLVERIDHASYADGVILSCIPGRLAYYRSESFEEDWFLERGTPV